MFPYSGTDQPVLMDAEALASNYPKAWKYLCRYETELRARERSSFDDDQWYRFGRNQNIDKQHLSKLGVAQTVPEMRVFYDSGGDFCLNNVRVNGILVEEASAWFVLGILNSRVADFVFRRISKPKEPRPSGAYFEANKQYIAPLPIPNVSDDQHKRVSELAEQLQALHSQRRDVIESINSRIASQQMANDPKEPKWIWADVHDTTHWKEENPNNLSGRALNRWTKQHYEALLDSKLSAMDDQMSFGQTMSATAEDGQLKFFVGDTCVIDGVYVTENQAKIFLPQWQHKARDTFVSESMNAKRIVTRLLDLRTTENEALIEQLGDLTGQLFATEEDILKTERILDDFIYGLYALTDEEIAIVEEDTSLRANARIPRVNQ